MDAPRDGGDEGTRRLWLVEREYDERNVIGLTYATEDGTETLRKEVSAAVVRQRGRGVTAAVDVDPAETTETPAEDRERYAAEAREMADRHDPDDEV